MDIGKKYTSKEIIDLVKHDISKMVNIPYEIRKDKTLMLEVVKETPGIFSILPANLKNDYDVVLTAISRSGELFQYAGGDIKLNENLLVEAINNGFEIKNVDRKVITNEKFLHRLFEMDYSSIIKIMDCYKRLKCDVNIIKKVLDSNDYQYFPEPYSKYNQYPVVKESDISINAIYKLNKKFKGKEFLLFVEKDDFKDNVESMAYDEGVADYFINFKEKDFKFVFTIYGDVFSKLVKFDDIECLDVFEYDNKYVAVLKDYDYSLYPSTFYEITSK